jgi:hypothetical protein
MLRRQGSLDCFGSLSFLGTLSMEGSLFTLVTFVIDGSL